MGKSNKTANKYKILEFKTVCNGDTAYITQLKQQKSQSCYYSGVRCWQRTPESMCCKCNSNFL